MEVLSTNGITIKVESHYQKKHSSPKENRYIHAYQVTIRNERDKPVKLLERMWRIMDANGLIRKVSGKGVIGKQPELAPGEEHRYVSWSPMSTDLGKMSGFYTFIELGSDTAFLVDIPEFKLICPNKLN
jgi:Uncharacterized protein affecting Mg2+/Co2+ transport